MPSIDTLVADLRNGTVNAFGSKPAGETSKEGIIDQTHKVTYRFVYMNASLNGTRLNCNAAEKAKPSNGSFLYFADSWSTVADMDINRSLVVSTNFSGCMWKIYRSRTPDLFKCVHIARSQNEGDALVNLLAAYAQSQRWAEVQAIPTRGHIGNNGCNEVIVVSQLSNRTIDTAVLDIDNGGRIVGTTFDLINI